MRAPILPHMRRRPLLATLAATAAAGAALPLALAADGDRVATTAAAPAQKLRCFGGPSRDVVKPCRNPALATKVFPTPADAVLYPNAECKPVVRSVPYQCLFGAPLERAKGTVALVGDSHATHWRSALLDVAKAYGWHGVSMTRAGCPLSKAEPVLPRRLKQDCLDWRKQVFAWFRANPQVRTVFVSQYAGRVVVPPGKTEQQVQREGYRDAWRALPDTVKHVVVIRDTPYVSFRTFACINRAIRRKQNAGERCARPREVALKRDYAAEAAERYDVPGVRVVDMTRFFCSQTRCFPVVGGALTHKDEGHITLVFGETLGPFLLRKVRALGIKI